MQIQDSTPSGSRPLTILSFGFRPFFLLAGLHGALSVAVWVAVYGGVLTFPGPLAPMLWHGHEMLFGFAMAVLSGFMLTASPNWTQTPPVTGGRLGLLVALWLAGRLAFVMADVLPAMVVAVADLLLAPTLAVVVAIPIFIRRQQRNYFFPVLLAVLFLANGLFHLEALGMAGGAAESGLFLAIYVFALMLSLVSGRIVPNFTAGALRLRGENVETKISMPVELSAFAAIAATAVADLAFDAAPVSGVLALVAAALLGLRMKNWHTFKTLDDPMLWVLHLGGVWLVVGFACMGVADLGGVVAKSTAFHALTIGAIGTMVLAVMTRAALGHTGRPFVVGKPIKAAYVLVSVAALSRVAGPALMPSGHEAFVIVAGLLWTAAFAFYTVVYWPILTGPRADGRPG